MCTCVPNIIHTIIIFFISAWKTRVWKMCFIIYECKTGYAHFFLAICSFALSTSLILLLSNFLSLCLSVSHFPSTEHEQNNFCVETQWIDCFIYEFLLAEDRMANARAIHFCLVNMPSLSVRVILSCLSSFRSL